MLRAKAKADEKGLTLLKARRRDDGTRISGRPQFPNATIRVLILICILALFALPSLNRSGYKNRTPGTAGTEEVYMTLLSPPRPHPASNRRIDWEFEATRLLAYRLLHKPSTKDRHQRRFVVLTTSDVPQEQIDTLRADGAEIRSIKALEGARTRKVSAKPEPQKQEPPKLAIRESRNEFTKLHLWNMTQYSKILYLEPDILVIRPLSDFFNIGFSKDIYGTSYLFAAKPENQSSVSTKSNAVENGNFSTSVFLLHPSVQHALYVNAIYRHSIHADTPSNMTETSLLHYAYRRDGPYPWQLIDPKYISEKPMLEDMTDGFALQGKFWEEGDHVNPDLRRFWYFAWGEMKGYYVNRRLRKDL